MQKIWSLWTSLDTIYVVQQDTQSVLMREFYSSRMLARHVPDLTGPKHVELTYVMNKTHSLKTLCILLDCIYILQDDTRSLQYQIFRHIAPADCLSDEQNHTHPITTQPLKCLATWLLVWSTVTNSVRSFYGYSCHSQLLQSTFCCDKFCNYAVYPNFGYETS